MDGGDLEDGVQVLHLEPDGPVHGPCGGDVLVELEVLELLEGGTGGTCDKKNMLVIRIVLEHE